MKSLPRFDLGEYRAVLLALSEKGFRLKPVSAMGAPEDFPAVYLRHDVDFFATAALAMARLEAELGLVATYYFLQTGPYNLEVSPEREALQEIVSLGHEIGLHYDLTTYPTTEALAHLGKERASLEALAGVPVSTITMHQPHQGGADPFRELDGLLHPHDPRLTQGLTYISDSCRGWRDETLLACLGEDSPRRVLLLTHPELWLEG